MNLPSCTSGPYRDNFMVWGWGFMWEQLTSQGTRKWKRDVSIDPYFEFRSPPWSHPPYCLTQPHWILFSRVVSSQVPWWGNWRAISASEKDLSSLLEFAAWFSLHIFPANIWVSRVPSITLGKGRQTWMRCQPFLWGTHPECRMETEE